MTRSAVYNRHWSTGGGAEKYGGVIAQILSHDGPLDLLSHEPVDVDWLSSRLHLDLDRVDVRVIDDDSYAVTRTSADYDMFVNVSYMSTARAATPLSVYVVHFPHRLGPDLGPVGRLAARGFVRMWGPSGPVGMEWGDGFHHRDAGSRQAIWTNGDGTLRFVTEPDAALPLRFVFGRQLPATLGPRAVRVEVDGKVEAEITLHPPGSRLDRLQSPSITLEVKSPHPGQPVEVRIMSDTFVPAEVLGTDDKRKLGVPLQAVHLGRGGLLRVAQRWLPVSMVAPASAAWAGSYGAVVSNSEFTRGWVQRWWDYDSEVLYPPVTLHEPGEKTQTILNVGRFFPAEAGHSKKQLELVTAFRRMCDNGLTGWTLHLAGGRAPAGSTYFDDVRRVAEGLPVELHPNATGDELQALYGAASIYWHASGLGEDEQRHPGRLEHFGITTVEAMSAGAVPVIIGLAGQRETVRHGVDGFHFHSLDGLCAETSLLIDDEARRRDMSVSARQRATAYSVDAFETNLRSVITKTLVRRADASATLETSA